MCKSHLFFQYKKEAVLMVKEKREKQFTDINQHSSVSLTMLKSDLSRKDRD